MDRAARMAGEIGMYLRTERSEMALLRISDLMNQTGYLNGRWEDRLSKKSNDNLFRAGAVALDAPVLSAKRDLGPEDKGPSNQSCQEVSEIFSMEQGVATRATTVGG